MGDKPMVTRDEYERARAVLDALPPGVYLKCSACHKWKHGGTIHFKSDWVVCEECG